MGFAIGYWKGSRPIFGTNFAAKSSKDRIKLPNHDWIENNKLQPGVQVLHDYDCPQPSLPSLDFREGVRDKLCDHSLGVVRADAGPDRGVVEPPNVAEEAGHRDEERVGQKDSDPNIRLDPESLVEHWGQHRLVPEGLVADQLAVQLQEDQPGN